ncbi:hypothetical protein F2P56_034087 [Juglans regia]|uniref:Phytocyanin domain-containing protein n=1 Tax=Juglans regia TaxID=51240 RepID=A0A833TPV9_JUGRE|nr:hypothetical protein F2P56_034087 [Juglans regia]
MEKLVVANGGPRRAGNAGVGSPTGGEVDGRGGVGSNHCCRRFRRLATWRFGFNYTDWALKTSPFYLNDKLVFKYAPPSDTYVAPNVYLLPNLLSYLACNFSSAKLLANETQGSGEGFEFVLNRWRPAYFASTAEDGSHCREGQMKFFAIPLPHPS